MLYTRQKTVIFQVLVVVSAIGDLDANGHIR